MTPLERKALAMWREREMRFPKFTRRMTPDAMDMVSGAWALMLKAASTELAMGVAEMTSAYTLDGAETIIATSQNV